MWGGRSPLAGNGIAGPAPRPPEAASPAPGASSAHPSEQIRVAGDDPLRLRRIGIEVPVAVLMRAAEQDAVAARKHVEISRPDGAIIHLRLRDQKRELAFDWCQL